MSWIEHTSFIDADILGEIFRQPTGGPMLSLSKASFPHRHNSDGSHDSICTECFATIAKAQSEGDLAEHESAHVCQPVDRSKAGPRLKQ
jgi:hypothetical protein